MEDLGVEWKIILEWIFIRVIRSQNKKDGAGDTTEVRTVFVGEI